MTAWFLITLYSQIFESRNLDEFEANLYWTFSLAVLPQVWSSDNHALHLREPFPGNFASLIRQCEFICKYFRDFQSEVCSPDWRLATILGDRICRLSLDLSRRNTATWVKQMMLCLCETWVWVWDRLRLPSLDLHLPKCTVHVGQNDENWWIIGDDAGMCRWAKWGCSVVAQEQSLEQTAGLVNRSP